MSSIWVLIVFFKIGYAGGATSLEMPSKEACVAAQQGIAKDRVNFQATYCVSKATGETIIVKW
ncbi:hypothetical protein [Zavarzinella formosa]|uniref:hypothetical protein n=1 Tax=Zavarzinella formosa TaxID=360055 RepID=UPI0002FF3E5A|nr:hypothetical protein [Zavarzinella formosa]